MLPVMEMSRMNFRAGKTEYAQSIGLRLPPKNLLTLFQPDLYGNPRDYVEILPNGERRTGHPYFGAFDFIEYCAYLGIPALILAGIGFAGSYGRRPLFFALLALLGLLLALGTHICALFFYAVPGYRQFNATARALCLFSFGSRPRGPTASTPCAIHRSNRAADRSANAATTTTLIVLLLGLVAFPGMALVEKAPNDAARWSPASSPISGSATSSPASFNSPSS